MSRPCFFVTLIPGCVVCIPAVQFRAALIRQAKGLNGHGLRGPQKFHATTLARFLYCGLINVPIHL
jgi:hypothetical protein